MVKQLLSALALICTSLGVQAQFLYSFKDTTTTYTRLTGATSVNGTTIWDEEDYNVTMPFTWKMDTATVSGFNLALGFPGFLSTNSAAVNASDVNGFTLGDIDIADRGLLMKTNSLSPIRYQTAGTSPNRIFKFEFANAGFYGEYDNYQTMADSFDLQVWIYETSNIVEYHFGGSKITYPSDYYGSFFGETGPFFGYGKHMDFMNGSTGSIYHLKGNPAGPSIDTFLLTSSSSPAALNSWPASGKVYRFTPKSNCAMPAAGFTSAAAVNKTVQFTYNGTTPVDSVRWEFGDGTTSKTLNPTHTFPSGSYSVCVTAYNSCGSNRICKPYSFSSAAVGNMEALGNVQVYPNPAHDVLTISGMAAGDKLSILSVVGQQVMSVAISSARQELNLSALPAGIYTLLLSKSTGVSGKLQFAKN